MCYVVFPKVTGSVFIRHGAVYSLQCSRDCTVMLKSLMTDCRALVQDMESDLLARRHRLVLFKSNTSRLSGGRGQVCFDRFCRVT